VFWQRSCRLRASPPAGTELDASRCQVVAGDNVSGTGARPRKVSRVRRIVARCERVAGRASRSSASARADDSRRAIARTYRSRAPPPAALAPSMLHSTTVGVPLAERSRGLDSALLFEG
jgi:hypothetical protein